jgi:hypothetical protein
MRSPTCSAQPQTKKTGENARVATFFAWIDSALSSLLSSYSTVATVGIANDPHPSTKDTFRVYPAMSFATKAWRFIHQFILSDQVGYDNRIEFSEPKRPSLPAFTALTRRPRAEARRHREYPGRFLYY